MARPITHGMSYERIYMVWVSMKVRCENTNHPSYKRHGARGITVCERWQSFENFYADMGAQPEGRTLDRIDNDGDYAPKNCRWASRKQQGNNRANNVVLKYRGETLTISEWADRLGMTSATLHARLTKYRWPVAKALSVPVRFKNPNGMGRAKK